MGLRTIKSKIIFLTVASVATVTLAVIGIIQYEQSVLRADLEADVQFLQQDGTSKIAQDVYRMCQLADETTRLKVARDSKWAADLLASKGGISVGIDPVSWNAIHPVTKATTSITLPQIMLGGVWLGQNADMQVETPFVDQVAAVTGNVCTIFQKVNDAGDMMRVATNIKIESGARAIGTMVVAKDEAGKANPMVESVLRGEAYILRIEAGGQWYLGHYAPLFDSAGKVIGILYVGVPESSQESLRKAVMSVVVGKTGYVFVLGGKDDQKGKYIISLGGKRDGENIWEAKDDAGNLFIQEMVNKALALKAEEGKIPTDFISYPWKNEGENAARMKIAAVCYYEPWDWVIGSSAYEEDYDTRGKIVTGFRTLMFQTAGGGILMLVIISIISLFVARAISKPLIVAADMLQDIAQGEGDLTRRLTVTSKDEVGALSQWFNVFVEKLQKMIADMAVNARTLAASSEELTVTATTMSAAAEEMTNQSNTAAAATEEASSNVKTIAAGLEEVSANTNTVASASEQVSANLNTVSSAVEEISSSLNTISAAMEEMTASVTSVATAIEETSASVGEVSKNSAQAARVSHTAVETAHKTAESVNRLGRSAQEVGKVVDLIKGIAGQTNLLALNATIEAASAGEAGRGFAVVANEVKELAKQTAAATEEIRSQIEGMQTNTQEAVQAIDQIVQVITEMNNTFGTIAAAVEEQTATTNEISRNVGGAAQAANDVSRNVQEAASSVNHVSRNVQEAAKGVNDVARNISELATGANAIARNAGEAAQGVNEVARNVTAVNSASQETARGAMDTNKAAQDLAELAARLQGVVSQFKV